MRIRLPCYLKHSYYFFGRAVRAVHLVEWRSLRTLRKSFLSLEKRLLASQHEAMKAAHRVISSYHIKDVDARISLLESVVKDCPGAFNAYNSLGYAYLEKNQINQAVDAFQKAIQQHPDDTWQ